MIIQQSRAVKWKSNVCCDSDMDPEEKEDMRNGRVAAIVHLSVLGWSATILTAGYLNIIKADPTFVASIFTGCLSAYGIQRADNSRKPDRPSEQPIKSSSPPLKK